MASSPFLHRAAHQILDRFDPLIGHVLDPFENFSLRDRVCAPSRQYVKDANAVANTQVDWLETAEAHIFKADLPGNKNSLNAFGNMHQEIVLMSNFEMKINMIFALHRLCEACHVDVWTVFVVWDNRTNDKNLFGTYESILTGLMRDDVKVKIEDGQTLEISGDRKKEEVRHTDTWHRVERTRGTFLRRLRLPENIDTSAVTAQVENGVLTITLPKIVAAKPQVRTIEVQ